MCGGVLDPENSSRCSICGGRFHMKWSVHVEMEECGRYIMNEEFCTLMFVCNPCIEKIKARQQAMQEHEMPQEPSQEGW